MRSRLKPPFILFKNIIKQKNETILPVHIGNNIQIFAEKKNFLLKPTQSMVGHRFGEFIFSNKKLNAYSKK